MKSPLRSQIFTFRRIMLPMSSDAGSPFGRFVSLFFFTFLLLAALPARAQVLTNKAVLQKASQDRALQEKDLQGKLMSLARQKGWSLTLRNTKGRLAYLVGVDSQGYPLYVTTTDNIISAATIQTSQLWPGGGTGLNLNGSSANMKGKIAVWDEGIVRPTHVELAGRVTQMDVPSGVSDHSTHVAGTMIASGVNPAAKGMSFGAQQLLAYDFNNDASEMMAAAANGLLLSSHSYTTIAGWYQNSSQGNRWEFWGNQGDTVDYKFGYYDKITQLWDSIAYNAPNYLIAKASGNNRSETGPAVGSPYYRYNASGQMVSSGSRPANLSSNNGYQIIATYGCAKNILTVGAVNPISGGYAKPADAVLANFSSWGPTADGRIKPDVVADGVNVLSSIGSADNAYDIYSGTSMATPASAGSAFLLQEYYSKLHGGTFMRSATLKGLLIHTADETGPSPGPDYQYGWGLINMQKAASVITSNNTDQLIRENNLVNTTHDVDSIIVVASGKTPLAATISWTDPPGSPNLSNLFDTSRKLINDLDLRITDGNTTFNPWVLDPRNRPAAATTGDNIRDNVEKVQVDSLIPGKTYTIRVTHKATLARGSQAYSLLVSGVGGTAYCPSSSGGVGTRIDKVTFSNINNTNPAGCKTYSDFTGSAAARLQLAQTLPFSISHSVCSGSPANTIISVYIDFNNNGSFNDPGEMVASSGLIASSSGAFTGNITIPATVTIGSYSRLRIVAEDTAAGTTATPCGNYASGETQDYRVLFTPSTNDVGVSSLEYPTLTTCASDSQLVAIRIRNFGTKLQTSVPVTTVIKNGATVVATLTATCKDSIVAGGDVVFTYGTVFPSVAGATYTFISKTALPGDLNTSNDQNTATLTVSAAGSSPSGTAVICDSSAGQVTLMAKATGNDLALWYTNPTATIPVAAGNNTTTTVIPANHTYYLGLNDLNGKAGPANKLTYTSGGGAYFRFRGNFVQFTTSVPLTIESAKMYIGWSGKVSLTLATLSSYTSSGYRYFPLYNTVIDVSATAANPVSAQQTNVVAGDNTDQGATYFLNIPVPVPGNYIIIIDCLNDGPTLFVNAPFNTGSPAIPYPLTLPGVISVTGNDFRDYPNADSLTYYKKFYFPFYNMGIRVSGCSGPRVPVVATTPVPPVITLNGKVFTSSVVNGNQWYRTNILLPGATNQIDTPIYSGVYKTVVTDSNGCTLSSNEINFVSTGASDINGASIGLTVSPNPTTGVFQLQFYLDKTDNLSISLINTLGQNVYAVSYPNFVGPFSQRIVADYLAAGMYVLKIRHGSKTYIKKILIKR